ncbi:MAG: hypothetical protein J7513_07285 [Solirubrobacteraceae bacterium]|nr:hypothetical protein [Solirubrobacteraceae bacterium]
MSTPNIDQQLGATPVVPAVAPLPRRSFLTGKVLDPELHPGLRTRIVRALRPR